MHSGIRCSSQYANTPWHSQGVLGNETPVCEVIVEQRAKEKKGGSTFTR